MTITLGIDHDNQKTCVSDVLASRRVAAEIVTGYRETTVEQLIGRDIILHSARHRATRALHLTPAVNISLGFAAGVSITPEGMFLACVVVGRTRSGKEVVGWNNPRRLPDVVAKGINEGHSLSLLVQDYRQQWREFDTVQLLDLDELIDRTQSYREALTTVFDVLLVKE